MRRQQEIVDEIKAFLLRHVLTGETPDAIDNSTRLIRDHVLDSISVVNLVAFIEGRYHVEIQAHEIDEENFDTLPSIARLIDSKLQR